MHVLLREGGRACTGSLRAASSGASPTAHPAGGATGAGWEDKTPHNLVFSRHEHKSRHHYTAGTYPARRAAAGPPG